MTAEHAAVALLWLAAVAFVGGAAFGRPPRMGAALLGLACALAAHALPIVLAAR